MEHEQEALKIAVIVKDTTKKINEYHPEGAYFIHVIQNTDLEEFPALSNTRPLVVQLTTVSNWIENLDDVQLEYYHAGDANMGMDSIESYIKFGKKVELTHLVIDGKSAQPNVLNDIFYNEKNYPYLLKQFDSMEHGF